MRIVFDPHTLHQSKKGSITGVVYFDFGDRQFPTAGWNDFVVVIAGWWLSELDRSDWNRAGATLRFMDGPYWISAATNESADVTLHCVEDRRDAEDLGKIIVSASEIKSEVLAFARAVLQACASARIASADLDVLRGLVGN
jgi:hypothetical protein